MLPRTCFLALGVVLLGTGASAQTYAPEQPRRQFVTLSYDWLYTHPLHFAEHPVADLAGAPVSSAQFEAWDYQTRDGATLIDVLEFKRRGRGAGVMVYPFGARTGPALMLRGSLEQLPRIRLAFDGPAPVSAYELTDAWALDAALGVLVSDRAPGWGLGSYTFLAAGVGRISSSLADGRRLFAEGGGGLGVGPLGVELSVKFAWNSLPEPVEHRFLTVPVTVRGTLTF